MILRILHIGTVLAAALGAYNLGGVHAGLLALGSLVALTMSGPLANGQTK